MPSNQPRGNGTGHRGGRGRGRGGTGGGGNRYAVVNGGNLCAAHSSCNTCNATIRDLKSKWAVSKANAKRMAAVVNYAMGAMNEDGDSAGPRFASVENSFVLNTCASESSGDLKQPPCGLCFENYTDGGVHNPVAFFENGCGHTVCKACFEKMRDTALSERKKMTCPYCRKDVTRAAALRM